MLKNSDYIKDKDDMHMGEYSMIGLDGLDTENNTTEFLEMENTGAADTLQTPFLNDEEKDKNPLGNNVGKDDQDALKAEAG